MRELARYVLESQRDNAIAAWREMVGLVEDWLAGKGHSNSPDFLMPNGRSATVERTDVACLAGQLTSWKLLEEIDGGFFETSLHCAVSGRDLRVSATVAAGHGSNRIAPLLVEGRCPGVIGRILDVGAWHLGPTPIARTPLAVSGQSGGKMLVQVLSQSERTLPVVVISTHLGLVLHPDMPTRMARDLTGLALVTVADDEASWCLTSTLGKSLSCFSGAVRLYWPSFRASDSVFTHPLWTAERLLDRSRGVVEAAQIICDTLRRRLMAVSVAALAEPSLFGSIRHADAHERAEVVRTRMSDEADFKSLANSYLAENERLRADIVGLESQIDAVRRQLWRLQTEAEWADAPQDLQPDTAAPPTTVKDAVDRARLLFASVLVFGDDVGQGVDQLVSNAGPPTKVFSYLQSLADLAQARRNGPLGKSMLQWLSERNVEGSEESDKVTRNRAEMSRRTWHDGTGRRAFEVHLKPKESAHPDQCVRIYFDWDEPSKQIVVGWVGRHP